MSMPSGPADVADASKDVRGTSVMVDARWPPRENVLRCRRNLP